MPAHLPASAEELRAGVQARFDAVNLALSTYRADSALSHFNNDDSGEWVDIDAELGEVLSYALSLAEDSGGAYDVTVGPLVNLWGFGPDPATGGCQKRRRSRAHACAWAGARSKSTRRSAARARLRVCASISRRSAKAAASIASRSISTRRASLTTSSTCRASCARTASTSHAERWRVAVEPPAADATSSQPPFTPAIIELVDQSVATAGDYRRFFEIDGKHYSHIIDPRTGWPVTHDTVSASAMASDCMQADALATVLMAMSPDAAIALANRRRLAALLIARTNGEFVARGTLAPGRRSNPVGRHCRAPRICADRTGELLDRRLGQNRGCERTAQSLADTEGHDGKLAR